MPYYKPILSPVARFVRNFYLPFAYGGTGVVCPICGRAFRGYVGSPHGCCPGCHAPDRSRLLWTFLQSQRPDLLVGSVLQIAPDPGLERKLRSIEWIRYLSGDLHEPDAMTCLDLTRLDLPDRCFDLVICIHVLAHIPNDRQAMREIYRVLKPGGYALIMTPTNSNATTHEDPTIIEPHERDKIFGEWDFVRVYGEDFVDRLVEAQFRVEIVRPAKNLSEATSKMLGIWNDQIFICRRDGLYRQAKDLR
jgi:SAM-dependent methyltransferase